MEIKIVWVETQSGIDIDGINLPHLIIGEREIEDVNVLLLSARIERARYRYLLQLYVPSKDNLLYALVILLGEALHDKILGESVVVASQWCISLDGYAMLMTEFHERFLREERMNLKLVDSRNNLAIVHDIFQMMLMAVSHTQHLNISLLVETFHLLVRIDEMVGYRPVEHEHIYVVESYLLQTTQEILPDSTIILLIVADT